MNKTITDFVLELRRLTGASFVYEQQCWCFLNEAFPKYRHSIRGMLQGFVGVTKETEEELISSFNLIRKQIDILMESHKIQKQLDTKLLNYPGGK